MALHLNLLHEEILEQRQRQRDPLKIGTMLLVALGALMVINYMWKGYQTLEIKGRLNAAKASWAQVEPKVTAAQKRSEEVNGIINTTKVLDGIIDGRFYWAPFLQRLSRCVAPNAQITSIEGTVVDDGKSVAVLLEGLAADREPRAAAEELRQLLIEQLGKAYGPVKVEFKTLEDLDTIAKLGGTNVPMARFGLSVEVTPGGAASKASGSATPAPVRRPKNHDEN